MAVMVINCGSSSVKAAVFSGDPPDRVQDLRVSGVGSSTSKLHAAGKVTDIHCPDPASALQAIFEQLKEAYDDLSSLTAVGHRVLHGGEKLIAPTRITEDIEQTIESMNMLAPLHNPACLAGIRAARQVLPGIDHVAVFDTAFHATLPTRARLYALPADLDSPVPLRRFGFHGISHDYVSQRAAEALNSDRENLRLISCHLGNGCSVTAVEYGRSVETSMGMTPLEGLVMGTRSGDLDPGVLLHIMRNNNFTADELDTLLNNKSGLLGMTGSNNMAEIETRAADGDESCRRAIHLFTHRVRKYVGAYAATMGGVDAIIFTGGIGENSPFIRHRIAQRLDFLGGSLDEDRNRDAKLSSGQSAIDVSQSTSRVKILVVKTDEELAIARQVGELLNRSSQDQSGARIPLAVSARHVHLDHATVETLFGPGHQLTPDHPLTQPGEFAAKETVTLVGPRNRIEGVRIIGPERPASQVEISRTDEFFLGIDAPVRVSGDTDNTPGITLIGPAGPARLKSGVICAFRHIHMHPDDAASFNLRHGDLVTVAVNSENRDLKFGDVLVRVDETYRLEMQLDTDEANAAGVSTGDVGVLIPSGEPRSRD